MTTTEDPTITHSPRSSSDPIPFLPPEGLAPNVVQAIARVRRDLPGVPKAQVMTDGPRYTYRGIEDVTAAIGPLMGRHCVVVAPSVTERKTTELTIGGKPWTQEELTVVFRLYGPGVQSGLVGQGPDMIEVGPFYGLGRDNSDKGTNKAMTQVYKQMLLQVFVIGDHHDDPDNYPAMDRDAHPREAEPAPVDHEAIAKAGGWHTVEHREEAKRDVRAELSKLVLAKRLVGATDAEQAEDAKELFRDYQRPDGLDQPPRPRTLGEHNAWKAAHLPTVPDALAAMETTPPAEAPQPPQEPLELVQPDPRHALRTLGALEAAYITGGDDGLYGLLGDFTTAQLTNLLVLQGLDTAGDDDMLRVRLFDAITADDDVTKRRANALGMTVKALRAEQAMKRGDPPR